MPCPAKELGGIAPFVAMFRFESKGRNICSERGAWMARACMWRVRARHAVPLLSEKAKANRTMSRSVPSNCDRGAMLRWHRQECLCYLTAAAWDVTCAAALFYLGFAGLHGADGGVVGDDAGGDAVGERHAVFADYAVRAVTGF